MVADLGLDSILLYRIDQEHGTFCFHTSVTTSPGVGPRHCTFSADGRFLYLINELGNTIDVFAYDNLQGTLLPLQTVSALPADFNGTSYCADIHLHPNGLFLYGSNRGHDSIVIYTVDPQTGLLNYIKHVDCLGQWPRNFALDPSGTFLLVAHQNSNSIASFWVDTQTGDLAPTGEVVHLPKPVCLQFMDTNLTAERRSSSC